MTVVFFSNYLSIHQLPFSDEMYEILGSDYHFVSCEPYNDDRKKMGWQQENRKYEVKSYESEQAYEYAKKLALESDIMIYGSAKYEFVKLRSDSKKIVFRYSERLLKRGLYDFLRSLDILRNIKFNFLTRTPNAYLLSASMYAPYDFRLTLAKFKKRFKWGYFPETKQYESIEQLLERNRDKRVSILWVARMIGWKHPEVLIPLAKELLRCGFDFEINMLGDGELFEPIQKAIAENGLEKYIYLHGSIPSDRVRDYMEKSDIFLFTSDYNEGWGAVLNESMNSACAAVCSDAIGSSGYLIEDGKNGLLYRNGDTDDLLQKVKLLMENTEYRQALGIAAYHTITDQWSAGEAARRFVQLGNAVLAGETVDFESGPLSKAEIIRPRKVW